MHIWCRDDSMISDHQMVTTYQIVATILRLFVSSFIFFKPGTIETFYHITLSSVLPRNSDL